MKMDIASNGGRGTQAERSGVEWRGAETRGFDPNDLLTPDELAVRLKVPKSWIYEKTRHRSLDPLPIIRLGKYIRFSWRDVAAWVERHKRN